MHNSSTVVFLLSTAAVLAVSAVQADVRVNEVMASNKSVIANAAGLYEDWVELYNSGSEAVDLSGWRLCDSTTKAWKKWHALPEGTTIPAGGYLIVWADGVDGLIDGELHVNVGYSASGEEVALAMPDGTLVSSFAFPAQMSDVSYGYDANGELAFFENPTPGAPNSPASGGVTPAVSFSEPHGYKTSPFQLSLMPATPTAKPVYYTLDGTSPADSSTRVLYTGPIAVSGTTVVRAAVVDNAATRIDVSTATYIFLEDVLAQDQTQNLPNFPGPSITSMILDGAANPDFKQWLWYGMVQSVVKGPDAARLVQGFQDIGTISLVTDPANLFDRENGIYVNAQDTKTVQPGEDSRKWERPANIEMIDPNGDVTQEFSVPAGIRLRGAYSRNSLFPKHSFRVFMRGDYGMGKLKFPLLGELSDRKEFEKFDLRADQNHAWPNEIGNQFDQPVNATYINDIFARDQQAEAGRPATRGKPYHLFINGQYWGLYQTQERLAEDYTTETFGGSKDDWDIVSVDSTGVSASNGNLDAFLAFRDITVNEGYGPDHPENYNRVRGLNADGVRDESLPVYLDVKNLADYVILAHWTADGDSPVNPVNPGMVNNLRMAFRRGPKGDGFKFFRHDNEHNLFQSFQNYNYSDVPELNAEIAAKWFVGPAVNPVHWGTERNDEGIDFASRGIDRSGVANFTERENGFNPFLIHDRLEANADYKVAFADRVKRLCFGNGVLTPERSAALYRARMEEIDNAIVAESARWGNYERPAYWGGENHFGRDNWLAACNRVLTDFIPQRTAYLLQYYREAGWYPSFDAPVASKTEGVLQAGEKLTLSAVKQIYYTTDGSDPRASGGAVSEKARVYADGIVPTTTTVTVFARAYDAATGEWSAKTEVKLTAELVDEPDPVDPVDPIDPPALTGSILTDENGFFISRTLIAAWDGSVNRFVSLGAETLDDALNTPSTAYWEESGYGVLAAYVSEVKGNFNYDNYGGENGGTDGGLPGGGRWNQEDWQLIRVSATLVVPSAGKWTICLGAAENTKFRLSITGHDVAFAMSDADIDAESHRVVKTFDFPVAGSYSFAYDGYRLQGSGTYVELSCAKGEVAASDFSTTTFTLVGKGTVETPVPQVPSVASIAIVDGKVVIAIDNAVKDVRYGYKFAETIEGLKTAATAWLDDPAAADGDLLLQAERTTPTGFYQIVTED